MQEFRLPILSATGLGSFTYDADGNQLSGRGMTLGYDLANRVSSVRQGGGAAAVTTTYAYDGDGVRRSAVYRDPPDPSNPNDVTRTWDYGWDLLNPVPLLTRERFEQVTTGGPPLARVTTADGVTISSLSYGTGFVREAVSGVGGNGTVFAHQDRLGSVIATTTPAGVTQGTIDYEPYGPVRSSTGSINSKMLFTGQYQDPTGLYHLRARQYDPATARFLSTDPVDRSALLAALSSYVYGDDNPTTYTDPSGEGAIKSGDESSSFTTLAVTLEEVLIPEPGSGAPTFVYPVKKGFRSNVITCPSDPRYCLHPTDNLPGYPGIDFSGSARTPIVAVEAGRVREFGSAQGGVALYLRGNSGIDYYYAHLRPPQLVTRGQRVQQGQIIGRITAHPTSSDHLHLGANANLGGRIVSRGREGTDDPRDPATRRARTIIQLISRARRT